MKKLVVLTGAGISAESGVKTFRDAGGLWEGHDVMEVASPQGWAKNQELVLDFYNQRRRQLKEVEPNEAHKLIAQLEDRFDVQVITQNVDDLHERGGSSKVLHLHGELLKVRSVYNDHDIYQWTDDLNLGDTCKNGHQLRPHIVWFGEAVPMMTLAIDMLSEADILLVIGTSLQVYPAAGLLHYLPEGNPIYLVDPKPGIHPKAFPNLHIIADKATTGVQELFKLL
jgi:NAD-dependent deacetylase